MPNVTFIMRSS